MYLHELKLWNFRKYGIIGDTFESSEPGLRVDKTEHPHPEKRKLVKLT
jgi:hypothetical protein